MELDVKSEISEKETKRGLVEWVSLLLAFHSSYKLKNALGLTLKEAVLL